MKQEVQIEGLLHNQLVKKSITSVSPYARYFLPALTPEPQPPHKSGKYPSQFPKTQQDDTPIVQNPDVYTAFMYI